MNVIVAAASAEFPAHHSASVVELGHGTLGDGQTWSAPRVLIEPLSGDVSVYNPSLLRLPSGEILFFY